MKLTAGVIRESLKGLGDNDDVLISVDVSTSDDEEEAGHRAFATEFDSCDVSSDRFGNHQQTTLFLIGELNFTITKG